MASSSPARLYCTLVGGVLVIAGIIGFFYSSSFDTGAANVAANTDDVFGILGVNGWHNVVHIALGALALAVAGSPYGARAYCLGIGLVYVLLAVWGFIDSDNILLGIIPVNNEDNFLHLILGLVGLAAGAATPSVASRDSGRPAPA
ncbi:MAG: hypothetical protein QOI10_563 [Solirubrobacterales bacterium]|jgi:hypothetical protein|nr:hypothetical protein [Solirubrobacterales bacterium]